MADNTHVINLLVRARSDVAEGFNNALQHMNKFSKDAGTRLNTVRDATNNYIHGIQTAETATKKFNETVEVSSDILDKRNNSIKELKKAEIELADAEKEHADAINNLDKNTDGAFGNLNNRIRSLSDLNLKHINILKDLQKQQESSSIAEQKAFDEKIRKQETIVKRFQTQLRNALQDRNKLFEASGIPDLEASVQSQTQKVKGLEVIASRAEVQEKIIKDQKGRAELEAFRVKASREIKLIAKIDIDDPRFDAAVEKLRLFRLEAEKAGGSDFGEKIGKQFRGIFIELDRTRQLLVAKGLNIELDDRGTIGRFTDKLRLLRHEYREGSRETDNFVERMGRMQRRLGSLSDSMDKSQAKLSRLSAASRGLIILVVIQFIEAFISILNAAGGALVAVAGSAAQAGVAIGGIFAAGISQALPIMGIFAATAFRLSNVFEALQQRQNARQQASTQGATQDEKAADALDRIRSASDGVISANEALEQAQLRVNEARKQATDRLEDLILKEKEARLAHQASILAFEGSQRTLRQSIAAGDVGATVEANLNVEESKLGVQRTALDKGRTTEELQSLQKTGPDGSDEVKQAVAGLEAAKRSADSARRSLAEARREASTTAVQGTGAARNLEFLLGEMSGAERRLYTTLARIQQRFREGITPITDILVNSFSRASRRIASLFERNDIFRAFTKLADALADSIDKVVAAVTRGQNIRAWIGIINEASRNVAPLTDILIKLSRIFLDIAVAAQPALRRFIGFLGNLVDMFIDATGAGDGTKGTIKDLSKVFLDGEKTLEKWVLLLVSIINLFAALTGAGGAEEGTKSIQELTDTINDAADSVRENSDEVQQFFKESLDVISIIGSVLLIIGQAIHDAFDPKSVEAFKNILVELVIPALVKVIHWLGVLAKIVSFFVDMPIVGDFIKLTLTFSILISVLGSLFTVFTPMILLVRKVGSAIIFMAEAFKILGISLTTGFGIVGIILLVIAALVFLQLKFNIFGKAFEFIKTAAKDFLSFLKDHWVDALILLFTGPFGPIIVLFKNFGPQIMKALSSVLSTLGDFFENVWNNRLVRFITTPFRTAISFVRGLAEGYVKAFSRVFDALKDFFQNPSWSSLKTLLLAPFRGIADVVKSIFDRVIKAVEDALDNAKQLVRDIIKGPVGAGLAAIIPGNDPVEKLRAQYKREEELQRQRKRARAFEDIQDARKKFGPPAEDPFPNKPGQRVDISKDHDKETDSVKRKNKVLKENQDETDKARRKNRDHGQQAEDTGDKVDRSNKKLRDTTAAGRAAGRGYTTAARSAGIAGSAIFTAMNLITDATNSVLGEFGAKTIKFAVKNPKAILQGISDVFAEGGMIGGYGLYDTVPLLMGMAAPGEAILTRHQQDWVNMALGSTFGMSLEELFMRERKPHYMAKGGTIPKPQQFAKGGFTGPGGSGEGFTPVWNQAKRVFDMTYFTGFEGHDKYTSSQNISDHFMKRALDMGNGVLTKGEDALNAFWKTKMARTVKQLIWRDVDQFQGFNIGGHKDHVHLALKDAYAFNAGLTARLINRAQRGLSIDELLAESEASGGNVTHLKKLKIAGRSGALKDILQKASDRAVGAANKYLDTKSGDQVPEGTASPTKPVPGIIGIARRAFAEAGVPFNNAIIRTLLGKESTGGKNYGPSGSLSATGPFQVIPGTFAGNAAPGHKDIMNPYDNALAAARYIKGRYGTLETLAAKTGLFTPAYKGYARGGFLGGIPKFMFGGAIPRRRKKRHFEDEPEFGPSRSRVRAEQRQRQAPKPQQLGPSRERVRAERRQRERPDVPAPQGSAFLPVRRPSYEPPVVKRAEREERSRRRGTEERDFPDYFDAMKNAARLKGKQILAEQKEQEATARIYARQFSSIFKTLPREARLQLTGDVRDEARPVISDPAEGIGKINEFIRSRLPSYEGQDTFSAAARFTQDVIRTTGQTGPSLGNRIYSAIAEMGAFAVPVPQTKILTTGRTLKAVGNVFSKARVPGRALSRAERDVAQNNRLLAQYERQFDEFLSGEMVINHNDIQKIRKLGNKPPRVGTRIKLPPPKQEEVDLVALRIEEAKSRQFKLNQLMERERERHMDRVANSRSSSLLGIGPRVPSKVNQYVKQIGKRAIGSLVSGQTPIGRIRSGIIPDDIGSISKRSPFNSSTLSSYERQFGDWDKQSIALQRQLDTLLTGRVPQSTTKRSELDFLKKLATARATDAQRAKKGLPATFNDTVMTTRKKLEDAKWGKAYSQEKMVNERERMMNNISRLSEKFGFSGKLSGIVPDRGELSGVQGKPFSDPNKIPWFHGTSKVFGGLPTSRGKRSDLGVYLTSDPYYAARYTDDSINEILFQLSSKPRIIPVGVNARKTLEMRGGASTGRQFNPILEKMLMAGKRYAPQEKDIISDLKSLTKITSSKQGILNTNIVERIQDSLEGGSKLIGQSIGPNFSGLGKNRRLLQTIISRMGFDSIRKVDASSDALIVLNEQIMRSLGKSIPVQKRPFRFNLPDQFPGLSGILPSANRSSGRGISPRGAGILPDRLDDSYRYFGSAPRRNALVNLPNKITDEERNALASAAGSLYHENRGLRVPGYLGRQPYSAFKKQGQPGFKEAIDFAPYTVRDEAIKNIRGLMSLFRKSGGLNEAQRLYRGVSTKVPEGTTNLRQQLDSLKPGDLYTPRGFQSTSQTREGAFRGSDAFFKLDAPKGFPALPQIYGSKLESELILPHGTGMRIKDTKNVPSSFYPQGNRVITAELEMTKYLERFLRNRVGQGQLFSGILPSQRKLGSSRLSSGIKSIGTSQRKSSPPPKGFEQGTSLIGDTTQLEKNIEKFNQKDILGYFKNKNIFGLSRGEGTEFKPSKDSIGGFAPPKFPTGIRNNVDVIQAAVKHVKEFFPTKKKLEPRWGNQLPEGGLSNSFILEQQKRFFREFRAQYGDVLAKILAASAVRNTGRLGLGYGAGQFARGGLLRSEIWERSADRRTTLTSEARALAHAEDARKREDADGKLTELNRVFPRHGLSNARGRARLKPSQVMEIARSVGLPGRPFERIAKGESGYFPGIVGNDPGGTKGYGLTQVTTKVNGAPFEKIVQKLGGWAQMLNPIKNLKAAKWLYDQAGLRPWKGTRYLAKGGFIPKPSMPSFFRGGFIGKPVRRFASGGTVTKPEVKSLTKAFSNPTASLNDLLQMINNVFRELSTISGNARKSFIKNYDRLKKPLRQALTEITEDGGLIDTMKTKFETLVKDLADGLKKSTYAFKNGTAIKKLNNQQIIEAEINNLDKARKDLQLHQRAILRDELKEAKKTLKSAQRRGDTAGKRSAEAAIKGINDRLKEIDSAISDNLADRFQKQQDLIDAALNETSRKININEVKQRLALIGGPGFSQDIGATNSLLGEKGNLLQEQRAKIEKAKVESSAIGNTEAVNSLTQALLDNELAIRENNKAIDDLRDSVFDKAIDTITSRAQSTIGPGNALKTIINTIGEISGKGPDLKALKTITQAAIDASRSALNNIVNHLRLDFGANFSGLQGADLVNALTTWINSPDFAAWRDAMGDVDRARLDKTINAIIENEGSLQENTKALMELNGQLNGPQSFSSAAWREFREAFYDGMGNLLPAYRPIPVPSAHTGALIASSGLVNVQAGETIQPANINKEWTNAQEVHEHVHITTPTQVVDPVWLSTRLAWDRKARK